MSLMLMVIGEWDGTAGLRRKDGESCLVWQNVLALNLIEALLNFTS